MKKGTDKPNDKPRKRKENYDKKLNIKGSLFDVLKVAFTPKPDEKEKASK